ncbi:putative leucine-rich repeat receptor-like protein kinase [Dorcoceras hygrometricum]|uniref:Putative leucine-rich repeat receptor-like protein kinase n=1 Tax=Dorcoceras hygrometricum TaxID=472368 RepID=A0A2Z7AQ63_9LAMI|nr:putative leucine-rich repeat receptor-like protein kinase [Dorcoceras hygrometricum]
MPPRRRGGGKATWYVVDESRALDSDEGEDVAQLSVPLRHRDRQTEVELENRTLQIDDMELVLARFQRMNPPTFTGFEGGFVSKGWVEHMEGLFDRVQYDEERRLSLEMFQLRDHAQRWWKGASRDE